MIREAISKIVNKDDLSFAEAYEVITEIIQGKSTSTQNAAFLAALSTKSAKAETIDEISGCVMAILDNIKTINTKSETFDIVGTGGDNSQSFNISTTSAFLIAASGIKVTKHGNKAASSQCGSADLLEALGININIDETKSLDILNKINLCFFYAPLYNNSMQYVSSIRKELGFRTVFNILGPLCNPCRPKSMLLGVYDKYLIHPLSQVLIKMGVKHAMVVSGKTKLDEITTCTDTHVCQIQNSWCKEFIIKPEDLGFKRSCLDDIKGASPDINAKITLDILNGKKGPMTDCVLLNTAASLFTCHKVASLQDGISLARTLIESKKALDVLYKFKELSNQ